MVGNIQAGFKDAHILKQTEIDKGGYMNLSAFDIFDFEKYLELRKEEKSDSLFVETFITK